MVPTMTRLSGSAKASTSSPNRHGMLKRVMAALRDSRADAFDRRPKIARGAVCKMPVSRNRPRAL